jgi:hypothetical protein
MTMAASQDEVVRRLQGKGVTQGWDVIYALSARKINELFQRQFVQNLAHGDHLPPMNGVVRISRESSVEFADLVLGHPLLSFDPKEAPQAAQFTIPVISGVVSSTIAGGGATNVDTTQWIQQAHGYTITGTVPLVKVKGDVEGQTHVGLRFEDGKNFFADLNLTDAAGTILGDRFRQILGDPVKGLRGYSLGTLDYAPNATDLTPAGEFAIATQQDSTDTKDAGRVLLLIPTTYNPGGGSPPPLALDNVVPDTMDTALLVSSRVLIGDIVGRLVSAAIGTENVKTTGEESGVWWVTTVGGRTSIPVWARTPFGGVLATVQSGTYDELQPVLLSLGGIGFGPRNGWFTAKWVHTWPQFWGVTVPGPVYSISLNGMATMSISLDVTYRPTVDPVTAVVSFTADTSIAVGVAKVEQGDETFTSIVAKGAATAISDQITEATTSALGDVLHLTVPQVGAFAVTNLLFPGEQTTRLQDVYVPGDLIAFGTLKAPDFVVTPPLATVTTAETLTFAVRGQQPTWSVSRGDGTIDKAGVYTPPVKVAQSRVVVVTATAQDQQAYAAVVVTPAQVRITPIMSVFRASDPNQQFVAALPGVTEKPVWKLSSSVGTVDGNGIYTPPAKVDAPIAVTLTARLGEEVGSAQIVVFPFPRWPAEVQVSPYAPAPLGPGATQRFTATYDEKPVEVAWSLIPQIGTIDKNGLYTAPDTVTTPQAVLVVAPDPRQPDHYSTAVVLLTPDDPRFIMRPEPDGPPTGRTGDTS